MVRLRWFWAGAMGGLLALAMAMACGGDPPGADRPVGTAAPAGQNQGRNRLGDETSPYLRLHADNPVHWYAWGPEALEAAQRSGKLIFLSIGYSSCHWCHVMNRESFSDPAIAAYLNQHFIAIKVDREERPDVDHLYLNAVQAMGQRGGWPLSVFLLPDGRPFLGGTYFPPADRVDAQGELEIPGFPRVLASVQTLYEKERERVEKQAAAVADFLRRSAESPQLTRTTIEPKLVTAAAQALLERFDPQHGGLGQAPHFAPKFPQPSACLFLLESARYARQPELARPVVAQAQRMAAGGICDQVGGGFHRYSVDRQWLIPHFEKMLYDQAQLVSLYSRLYAQDAQPLYRRVVADTIEFVRRELTSPEGLFYSALDAESEHEEGKFYVWTREELEGILGNDAQWILPMVGAAGEPNFVEGGRPRYILWLAQPIGQVAKNLGTTAEDLHARWNAARSRLLAARAGRPRPLLDTKVITVWNALMIVGLADAAEVFGEEEYRRMAVTAAGAFLEKLRGPDGRLFQHRIESQSKGRAFSDDYAAGVLALLAVHRIDPRPRYLQAATELADTLLADFFDPRAGGFFYAPRDDHQLVAPLKENHDGAIPSSNGLAALALVELAESTGSEGDRQRNLSEGDRQRNLSQRYRQHALATFRAHGSLLAESPGAVTTMLRALVRYFQAGPALVSDDPTRPAGPEEPIRKIEVVPQRVEAGPGQSVSLRIRIQLEPGWHLNANPASPKFLRPTEVTLEADSVAELVRVRYPAAVSARIGELSEPVSVYEGTFEIFLDAKVKADALGGDSQLRLRIAYQACDDQRCLAPATKTVTVPVTVPAPR